MPQRDLTAWKSEPETVFVERCSELACAIRAAHVIGSLPQRAPELEWSDLTVPFPTCTWPEAGGAASFEVLPRVPDPSRFLGRVGVPAIFSAPSLTFCRSDFVLLSFSSDRIDPHQSIITSLVPRARTPHPIPRRTHQSTLHRIQVHVFQLLHLLLVTPHIEIVKPPLPELRQRILSSKLKLELANNFLPPPPPHLPRHSLLQHLQHRRRRPFRRLAHQQMNVFRHHHESDQSKSVSIAKLTQYLHKQVARSLRSQQRQPPVTTASDEMQIVLAVIPLEFSMHKN